MLNEIQSTRCGLLVVVVVVSGNVLLAKRDCLSIAYRCHCNVPANMWHHHMRSRLPQLSASLLRRITRGRSQGEGWEVAKWTRKRHAEADSQSLPSCKENTRSPRRLAKAGRKILSLSLTRAHTHTHSLFLFLSEISHFERQRSLTHDDVHRLIFKAHSALSTRELH